MGEQLFLEHFVWFDNETIRWKGISPTDPLIFKISDRLLPSAQRLARLHVRADDASTGGNDCISVPSRRRVATHLANTFGTFQNLTRFNVVLRFTPERLRWVKGEPWHEGQGEVIKDDGSLVLTIPVSHETEIMMETLKHGSQVEVLEPEWLRKRVKWRML
jgi:predicted DNA-binding transcriptional regulator YafY